ncbi:MAG: hypothetical protein ACFCVH_14365 [Alphaproteobacteria bacterium]
MKRTPIIRCACSYPALAAAILSCVAIAGGHASDLDAADGGEETGTQRYAEILDGDGGAMGADGFQRRVGAVVVTFDPAETDALVAAGWQPLAPAGSGDFADHGERVTTFVAIAEALGLDPAIGAQQANWGTPQENGLHELAEAVAAVRYDLDVAGYDISELERHQDDAVSVLAGIQASIVVQEPNDAVEDMAATIAALKAEIASVDTQLIARRTQVEALQHSLADLEFALAAAMERQSGEMPPAGWASASLDVNGDGIVNRADLDAARNPERPADGGGVAE